jgi:heme exporter protein C
MTANVAAAFVWARPAESFVGESSRIVFFHVPCAWGATLAFFMAAGYSAAFLKKRTCAAAAAAAAQLGFCSVSSPR